MTAFSCGLTCSMRAIAASTSSRAVTSRRRTSSACAVASSDANRASRTGVFVNATCGIVNRAWPAGIRYRLRLDFASVGRVHRAALARASTARSRVAEQRPHIDAPARRKQWRPQVAAPRDAGGNVVDAKILDRDAAPYLVPGDRRRHRRLRRRAYRVDRRQRATPGVLVVVDQHAPGGTLGDLIDGRHQVGVARGEVDREALRQLPHLVLRRAADDRDVDVQAARAGGLHVRREAEGAETLVDEERALTDVRERRAGAGIEIEMHVVGTIDVV